MHLKKPMSFLNRYIAFEGIDASGKSTQAKLFCEFLKQEGRSVVCTKEPGGTKSTRKIREVLLHEKLNAKARLFMFLADRAMHIEALKHEDEKTFIVSDRSLFSTIAYQAFGEGLELDFVERSNIFATDGVLPDVTFIIDINIETMHKRLGKPDMIESKGDEFFERVREGYKHIARSYKNVYIVNGEDKTKKVFEDIVGIWKSL